MSELREVWLVLRQYHIGGEYTKEVVIAVYPGEKEASQHTELAQGTIPADVLNPEDWKKYKNPYDPLLRISPWSGIFYSYRTEKVPFALHVDQFLERVPE